MLNWAEFFREIETKKYWETLNDFLNFEYENYEIYPERKNMFNAFNFTKLENLKVVVIGQDPYHEPGQATGISFSVPEGCKLPPSLVNIFKEIENETGKPMKRNGDLTYLATQGVFLINTILTVRKGAAMSHKRPEYKEFTRDLLYFLDKLDQPIVFMLWGGPAQKFEKFITNKNRLVIKRTHPSPLGANQGGWFNENQFNICNNFLKENGVNPIDWNN